MKLHLKRAIVGAATLAIAAGGLSVFAGPASAANSPWEPDPNKLGSVVFYDAAGNVLTGGSNLTRLADYYAASTAKTPGSIKATLYFAAPDPAIADPLGWPQTQRSASQAFPNATYVAPLTGPGFANPVVKAGSSDGNLSTFVATTTPQTAAGYVNVVQVRLYDTNSNTNYWETNVTYNTAAGTWAVNDPSVAATATSISANPASPQVVGGNITLNSTVTSASNGTVQFFNGATAIGSPQAVTTASGAASTVVTSPAVGSYAFKAVFTPTGGTLVQGSSSSVLNYSVTNAVPSTSTALTSNVSTAPAFSPVVFTANVKTPATSGSPTSAGKVEFLDGTSVIGTALTDDGTVGEFKLTYSSFSTAGSPHQITARFVPTDPAALGGSTSNVVSVATTAATCPGSPTTNPLTLEPGCQDTQYIQVTVNAGTLTITTPYTATNPFVLPAMVLNAAGTQLTSSAQFPALNDPSITVNSSISGDPNWTVSVSGSDLTGLASASNKINGQNLGLTGGALVGTRTNGGSVIFTDNPALSPAVQPGAAGQLGIKGGPHTFAVSTGGGNGTTNMKGVLTLNAPTNTVADTYTGTILFSVA